MEVCGAMRERTREWERGLRSEQSKGSQGERWGGFESGKTGAFYDIKTLEMSVRGFRGLIAEGSQKMCSLHGQQSGESPLLRQAGGRSRDQPVQVIYCSIANVERVEERNLTFKSTLLHQKLKPHKITPIIKFTKVEQTNLCIWISLSLNWIRVHYQLVWSYMIVPLFSQRVLHNI